MAAEAEAAREARAKVRPGIIMTVIESNPGGCLLDLSLYEPNNDQVIAAEGEQKASRALREAADVISESPAALQVSSYQK